MNVRPTYLFFTSPSPKGIPDSSAYPMAATVPESGTAMTISASAGYCLASIRPAFLRLLYTLLPSRLLSGLAKYTNSKEQRAFLVLLSNLIDSIPSSSITTISPGSTSRMNSAPVTSSAQLSDAKTYPLPSFPTQRGLRPFGSLTPMSLFSQIIVKAYAPFIL